MATIDVTKALDEFRVLKNDNQQRNVDYYLNRQAVKGNFRWPRDWPNHIPKVKHNMCKAIAERFSTYLMGRQFTYNVDRPNTLEFREQAERSEKILRRLMHLAEGETQFLQGAHTGSTVGRTIFKVYKKGKGDNAHACFTQCQPDYFYGIPATDQPGDYAKVFYSYPIDISEAQRLFGERPYKSEADMENSSHYDPLPEEQRGLDAEVRRGRRIPILEVWTREAYLIIAGGLVVFNGDNPYKWTDTDEGFIPYVVIENITNAGEATGESDIQQIRDLNEQLNYLLSRKQYVVGRWLQPTLVWEGAPQNYLDVLTSTIGGGGAIPTRLGSRLYFLAYDRPNPAVQELEASLRVAILETAGLNEVAFQGNVHGYINTGPSVNAQYQPTEAVIQKKQGMWESGIEKVFAMLLQLQEDIGDSKALGLTVVNASISSKDNSDGDVVELSGHDIAGLREVTITWPGLLPKDDAQAAQLELQKAQQGLQSIYTTLEKLGEDYPDDEIARIRMENTDPALKGEKVAEQMRAQGQYAQQMANAQATAQDAGGAPPQDGGPPPDAGAGPPGEDQLMQQGNVGARLRQLARNAKPQLDASGDQPVIGGGASPGGY